MDAEGMWAGRSTPVDVLVKLCVRTVIGGSGRWVTHRVSVVLPMKFEVSPFHTASDQLLCLATRAEKTFTALRIETGIVKESKPTKNPVEDEQSCCESIPVS